MAGSEQSPAAPSGAGLALATTTGFIVAAVIIFLILFIFIFLLCLRVHRCWGANPTSGGDYVRPSAAAAAARQSGLDSAALKAIPWTVFRSEDFKDGAAECCAVCLTELSAGEAARRLPSCHHAFHLECIDMWFYSHATCPLCRSPAAAAAATLDAPKQPALAAESSPDSPVCVLLSALQARASVNGYTGSREGSPSSAADPSGRSEGQITAMQLPNSPLMSLRRLLGTANRMANSSPSSRSGDIEQGRLQPSRVQTISP